MYETLPGWASRSTASTTEELPAAARAYVDFVEQELGVEVCLVGTGADRERILAARGLEAIARG